MGQVILAGQSFQRPAQQWDHLVVASGSAPAAIVPFFSVPISQTGLGVTGRTKFDTNLIQGNRRNPGEVYVLTQLGFRFNPNMLLSDIFLVLNGGYFELHLQAPDAVFADGPLWLYPTGGGISGFSTRNAESVWDIGVPNLTVQRNWGVDDGFNVTDQMYFGVDLKFPGTPPTMTGTNGLDLWCILDGLQTTLVHG
jgi:hypothetical protein